jgi:hypothetical protein
MCNTCAELDKHIGRLKVIAWVADAGTRDAATRLIKEIETEKSQFHSGPGNLSQKTSVLDPQV